MPPRVRRLPAGRQRTSSSPPQRLARRPRPRVPGEAFAADGTLIEGGTEADESLLTGESAAGSEGAAGDAAVAGSINSTPPSCSASSASARTPATSPSWP